MPINVLTHASRTVRFLKPPDLALCTNLPSPARIAGISASVGGVNSTLAYFAKISNFGLAIINPSEKKNRFNQ